MRVLITGGAGFVGSAVVEELLREQPATEVAVLDSFHTGQRSFLPSSQQIEVLECDLRDAAAVGRVVGEVRPTHVIHLAALHFIPYCNEHPAEAVAVNIGGTQHLLDACRICPPESLAIASSAAVYPISDTFNREDVSLPKPTDIYGLTKWCNEEQLRLYAAQTNTKCGVARISNVYGRRETNAHIVPEILYQMLNGSNALRLGNVSPKRDYIHVTDVARAFVALAYRNTHNYRAFNIGTGNEYSVRELVEILARISGKRLQIETASDRVRKSDRPFLRSDTARARDELGFVAKCNIEAGLSNLWQWALNDAESTKLPFRDDQKRA